MTDGLAVARRAAERGAAVALDRFDRDVTVDARASPMDPVTAADTAAREAIVATVRERFPDDAVVGEEGDELKRVPATGDAWVIDPIDGTTNFVHGLDTWGPAVAAVRDGAPWRPWRPCPPPATRTSPTGPVGSRCTAPSAR
jgi:myo-inositol-1(or 4)-monophosphatase